jgi:hypothetical protein
MMVRAARSESRPPRRLSSSAGESCAWGQLGRWSSQLVRAVRSSGRVRGSSRSLPPSRPLPRTRRLPLRVERERRTRPFLRLPTIPRPHQRLGRPATTRVRRHRHHQPTPAAAVVRHVALGTANPPDQGHVGQDHPMAKSIPALVEPTMLRWARVPIDLPAIAASRKLDLPDDRVAAWEAGDERPTVAQLRKGRPALPPLTRCVLPARAAAGLRHTPRPPPARRCGSRTVVASPVRRLPPGT